MWYQILMDVCHVGSEAWRGGIHPFEEFLQVFTPQLGWSQVPLWEAVPQVTKPWENIGDYPLENIGWFK